MSIDKHTFLCFLPKFFTIFSILFHSLFIKTVFEPGYTTKIRGWGLGLSLVKRIIEDYHKGQVYILHSELGKGSTFRISLLKS